MPKADCKQCGGTGWLITEEDGISSADRCVCSKERNAGELEELAHIPENYRRASFDTFAIPQNNPVLERSLKQAMFEVSGYATRFPAVPKPGLLLVGPPGAGKTHLAVAAMRTLNARGHEGIFFDYQNLLEQIRSGYSEALGTSSREAYRSALDTEILLLDDLGAHRVTDWVDDTVTSIITYRYNHKKPLIATTNLPDPDMGGLTVDKSGPAGPTFRITLEERIGVRARSRLFEMCTVVRMWGVTDYRIRPVRPGDRN